MERYKSLYISGWQRGGGGEGGGGGIKQKI